MVLVRLNAEQLLVTSTVRAGKNLRMNQQHGIEQYPREIQVSGWSDADGSLLGIFILTRVGQWYAAHRRANVGKAPASMVLPFDRRTTLIALGVLTVLTLTKNAYMAGLSSYYTFFLIEKFHVAVQDSQLLLFVYLGASAIGVFIGGPVR